ncbi:GC-rich sequence DNA-binding factor-like protein [Ancylostoma duodenale]|uniref:GC-rich sequence DNA-binding factor-like protein n=1 Tax=Ancylostoma duodenale TaxID=51022 RepID=A0A0C2GFM5_9BILA|nr:GC-rich sequence DNA-binding factor-like protein [Ancylostoma duodenale]
MIPLDDDQKLVDKGVRSRLIREDENDDSDEEAPKFYSSKDLLRVEEERRREEQDHFLEQEQGDEREVDEEADEWEKQQILKAVSRHTVTLLVPEATDMDIDMDGVVESFKGKSIGPANTGGTITVEDILAKLKTYVVDREERLNARRHEVSKIEQTMEENKETIRKIESEMPVLANKYAMYQELRIYSRSLLECLNEKVAEINELGDKRQALAKARVERLARRRRRDIRDAYNDCVTAAAGKNPSLTRTPDVMIRVAERDARRARRRREREGTLAGISHEEGLSSDDDEPTSQQLADQQAAAEIDTALRMVFVDALDDYAHLRKVLDRMIDWFAVDGTTFQDAYVQLCIPKLASPYVRIQLITADILNRDDFLLSAMPWYIDCVQAAEGNTDVDPKHEIIKGIIPLIIEKVVLPFLTDVVNVEWEPMSLKQSQRLGAVLSGLSDYPKLNVEDSKSFAVLAAAVKTKITTAIDDDLFVPIYSKQSIKNPATGCAAFLDRQYWAAIKLLRGLRAFSSFLNPATRLELVLDGVVNRVCVVALETGILDDASCERKMSWQRMSIVVDRYERLAISELRDLRKLQRMAMNPSTDSASVRSQIDRIGQHLQSGLAQLLGERENLDADGQDQFDARVESIRKQIQSAIHATASLPPLESKNPFDEPDSDDSNPYEAERRRYVQETDSRALELKAKAEEARMVAEATAKLNKDMRDLEDIFAELATIVHEQHEVVDSIEVNTTEAKKNYMMKGGS